MKTKINKLKKKIKYKKKIMYKKSYITKEKYIYYNFFLQQSNKKIKCNIYDDKKNLKNIDYLDYGCDAYSIIWLKNIWLKNDKVGLNYTIVQLKVYKPIIQINECLIIEDDDIFKHHSGNDRNDRNDHNDHTASVSIDPMYEKYFKMKKMGVPIRAIKIKMQLEGYDPVLLNRGSKETYNYVSNETSSKTSSKTSKKSLLSHVDLLKGIRNKKLKKIKNKTNKKDLLQKIGIRKNQNGIPTLEEILQTRKLLKKIR